MRHQKNPGRRSAPCGRTHRGCAWGASRLSTAPVLTRRLPGAQGFTLLELMITVAIVAILTLIAYPAYEQQMMKTRRSDAETALTNLSNQETLFFSQNNYYTASITPSTTGLSLNDLSTLSPKQYYQLAVTASKTYTAAASNNAYTMSATPLAGGPQASDGTFTLNSQGQKQFILNGTTQSNWP